MNRNSDEKTNEHAWTGSWTQTRMQCELYYVISQASYTCRQMMHRKSVEFCHFTNIVTPTTILTRMNMATNTNEHGHGHEWTWARMNIETDTNEHGHEHEWTWTRTRMNMDANTGCELNYVISHASYTLDKRCTKSHLSSVISRT